MSSTELLASIIKSDYHSSSKIMQKFLSERMPSNLAESLQSAFENQRNLRIRDHVAHFLSIEPVYCALEIPSYKLLDVVKGAADRYEVSRLIFEYTRALVYTKSPLFNSKAIRIEKTASSVYSVLLPEILHRRVQEIRDCKVPFTVKFGRGYQRTLYYIGHLLDTKYGSSILNTFPNLGIQSVVDEKKWNQIAQALSDLGYEPESMYKEIPTSEWHLHLRSLDKRNNRSKPFEINKQPNDEVEAIQRLDEAILAWEKEGNSEFLRFQILKEIKNLRTRHYNKELIQQLPALAERHQEIIIDILINTGDPTSEELLNSYLESENPHKRKLGARGLSRLNTLESPILAGDPATSELINIAELMVSTIRGERRRSTNSTLRLLAKSKISRVRKDLARILVELRDRETSELFLQLVSDPSEEVGMEVLSHIDRLPRELAREIVKAAYNSSNAQIVAKAEEAALAFSDFE